MLLLHLVGCLYYCIRDARSHKHQIAICKKSSRYVLILYIHFITYIYINIYINIYIYIFQSTQLHNKSIGYSDMFRLKSHRQAKLRAMKFCTMWLCAFGIPRWLTVCAVIRTVHITWLISIILLYLYWGPVCDVCGTTGITNRSPISEQRSQQIAR